MKKKLNYLYIISVIAFALPLFAVDKPLPVLLDGSKDLYSIGRNLEILEDKTGSLSFEDVSSPAFAGLFVKSEKDIPNYSISESVFWVRFMITFTKSASENSRWLIKCGWPHLSSVKAYIPEPDGRYRISETGTSCPVSSREIPCSVFVFRVTNQPGKTVTAYIRIKSTGTMLLPLSVISEKKLLREIGTDSGITGAFIGIMFIMIFYHLLLYVALRNKDYLYFVLFILANILFYVVNEGMMQEYLLFSEKTIVVFMAFTITAGAAMSILFTVHFLNLKKDIPAAARLYYILMSIYLLLALSSFLLPANQLWDFIFLLSMSDYLILGTIVIIRLIQGYQMAKYFLIIYIFELVNNFSYMLARFNLISPDIISGNVLLLFTITQALILSYAISLRIKNIDIERIKAQALAIENLEKSERIKDEFLANTSHELNTPLHGIVGLSELMLKSGSEKLGEKTRENISLISASSRRLMNLVNDILDFSSIRYGSFKLTMTPVNLQPTVSAVFSLLSPLIEGKAIELRNTIPADFPSTFADEARLRQILINLVDNALKFTPFGVIEISARINNDGMVQVYVSDTGSGISPDSFEKIFNSFEQGGSSISRSHGGTGLGLAITKKLVELQGGSIKVVSEQGRGSTFAFTLPVAESSNETANAAAVKNTEEMTENITNNPAVCLPEQDFIRGERPSILVVEDDTVSMKILFDYLTLLKYNVYKAHDGTAALEKLRDKNHFDLILLDVMMPGLSGYDLLKRIRLDLTPEELPVILVTAKSQLDDINAGFKAGANDYIVKPFNMDELSRRVENMLRLKNVLIPEEPGLLIKEKSTSRIIQYKNIVYLSSAGKKSIAHTTTRDEIISLMLKDLEAKLPHSFIRIHKQYIINTLYLSSVTHIESGRYEATLNDADDTRLVVSRSFIADLKKFLNEKG
ncbi:MAG TPA: 7TM-DISM domain-containing protein [Spirochaetota bacterium]|nr:7TM-DISM domain-containing protein [Spirochaetota bacterium]